MKYNTPSRSVTDDDGDSISHLEWETVRVSRMFSVSKNHSLVVSIDINDPVQVRFIKAGTMEKLVESLASDTGELESTYINVFLATYRTFASPKQVLNLLTER